MMKSGKETLGILLTALSGFGAAALHAWLTWPAYAFTKESYRSVHAEDIRSAAIFETCCIFFAVVYRAGQFIARRLGDRTSESMLKKQQHSHMKVLNVCAGGWIILNRAYFNTYPDDPRWKNIFMICVGIWILLGAILIKPITKKDAYG
ncbi:MAG: hypothetical protein NTZ28_04140 [Nitrospirae bacterium]|nr:hypothetical protein [Nitrospirota bacterium]